MAGIRPKVFSWGDITVGKQEWREMIALHNSAISEKNLVKFKTNNPLPMAPLGPHPGDVEDVPLLPVNTFNTRISKFQTLMANWDKKNDAAEKGFNELLGLLQFTFEVDTPASNMVVMIVSDDTIALADKYTAAMNALTALYRPSTAGDIAVIKAKLMAINDDKGSYWDFYKLYTAGITTLASYNSPLLEDEKALIFKMGINNHYLRPMIQMNFAMSNPPHSIMLTETVIRNISNYLLSNPEHCKFTKSAAFNAKTDNAANESNKDNKEKKRKRADNTFNDNKAINKNPPKTVTPVIPSNTERNGNDLYCVKCGREGHIAIDCRAKVCIRCNKQLTPERHVCSKFVRREQGKQQRDWSKAGGYNKQAGKRKN